MTGGWLGPLLLVAVAVVLSGVLSAWLQRRIGSPRKATEGQHAQCWHLDAGLRVLSGEHPGLSHRWRHGRAALGPGRITLRPFRWGLRISPMASVVVDVAAITGGTAQRSGWRSAWSVSPGARLLEVTTTSGARLHLAAASTASDEVLHVLAGDQA